MKTPESIRTSFQTGEWLMSLDFKDPYFHIPIHTQSRNISICLLFKVHPTSLEPYHLVCPQPLSSGEEAKPIARHKGIRIHLHPLNHALQIFRHIKRRMGHSLKGAHCKRSLIHPKSKLHINYLELKAVFVALKEFQDLFLSRYSTHSNR